MHFTPYHKRKSWQRFLIGILVGSLLSYCILIFMYGTMYETLLETNYELKAQINELKSQNDALLQDHKDTDEESKSASTVERIEVSISNAEQLDLDRLTIRQLDELIKKEINHIIGQDVQIIAESHQLLQTSIENKSFVIDDFTYSLEIKRLVISQTIVLTLHAKAYT